MTSVGGTAPVASSGGTAPTISMPVASGSVSGYLSSSNWTTFNNKTSNTGTVTSVSGGVGVDSTGGTTPSISLDLNELPGSATLVGTDDIVVVNGTASQKEQISSIPLSIFNNNSGWTSLGLGTSNTTAYRGDYGNTAYTHSQNNNQAHSDYLKNNANDSTSGSLTATNFILQSDIRLKENIITAKTILELPEIKEFNFIKDEDKRVRRGVIAQELQEVAPEMVHENDEGFFQVDYTDFLLAKVAILEKKLEKMDDIERRLIKLENK